MAGVSECFSIGSIVACKTCYNREIEGEVVAFDPQTKMLILKCASSSNRPNLNNVHIVNLSLVSDVQIKKEVNIVPDPPLPLDLNMLTARVRKQIEEKRRLVSALDAGVTPYGHKLFRTILKTISDVTWQGPNIVVLKQVTITPPYKLDDVNGVPDTKAFDYVHKVVRKHEKDMQMLENEKHNKLSPSNSVSPQ